MQLPNHCSSAMTGTVFDVQHGSMTDGQGVRTTIFLKGCPLHCKWCHNPESQSVKPQLMFYRNKCTACGRCLEACPARSLSCGSIKLDREKCILCGRCAELCPNDANELCGRTATVSEIILEACSDQPFYRDDGGITISGGEPAMQPEFTLALIHCAAENGIRSAIETCGFGSSGFFTAAHEAGAAFLFDIKALDDQKHRELTGVSNDLILHNLKQLFVLHADVTIRLPIIPNVNDFTEDIEKLEVFLVENIGKYRRAELIPYHSLGKSKQAALGRSSDSYDSSISREKAEKISELLRMRKIAAEVI